jgi:hypothetical protein
VGAWDEEDDWVGEPPEGRHSASRADPSFWRRSKPVAVSGAIAGIALIVLVIVLLLG